MKKQTYTTKQFPVSGSNEMKPVSEARSDWKVDQLGALVHDATKDVTEQSQAEVQYRRLLEDHTLRQVTDQRDDDQERKAAKIFFYIAMSVLLTALAAILYLQQNGQA